MKALRKGVTLVELMIALVLVTVGILAMVQSFGFIQKAIQSSKNRTLASNLAQEKMQILKQKVYYQVLVTSDPAHNDTDFLPDVIDYDTGYFPPETITEAGVTYTRYTYVQVAREDSGEIKTLPPNIPDTGMRLITVTVTWAQGGVKKKLSLRSLMSNPDTVMSNASFSGLVRDISAAGTPPIQGALVNVAENMGWRDTTNASGIYGISVSPGNYTLVASADGYYTQVRTVGIAPNSSQNQGFDMVKIATGAVTGAVWLRNHLVISQVVASTVMVNGVNAEYVELYNPTTYSIKIGDATGNNIKIRYYGENGSSHDVDEFNLSYGSNNSIGAGKYYLITNTYPMTVGGATPLPDAMFGPVSLNEGCGLSGFTDNCIREGEAGALQLTDSAGNVLDTVGWSHGSNGKSAPAWEGTPLAQWNGFPSAWELRRKSEYNHSPNGYGRAYDSNSNDPDLEFLDMTNPSISTPCATGCGVNPPLTGTPAVGAVVTASDGVSDSTTAWLNNGVSSFTLVNVATGTWTVMITSGAYQLEHDTVTVAGPGTTFLFGSSSTVLSDPVTTAIITGRIISAAGTVISPGIVVNPGAAGPSSTSNTGTGRYTLRVTPGIVDVTANPASGGTPSYVTMSSNSIQVDAGEVHSGVDFVLYQGGRITGFVTRDGINALPGVSVAVFDSNGAARDQQVTGIDGRFTTMNISTGTYTVQPEIGSHELTNPVTSTVTLVTPGVTLFSSTFTISGAMGYITGSVSAGGQPIKTGVLIVVTTGTLSGTPPAPPSLSTATLVSTPYYLVSSMENGTYTAEVRQSTAPKYNVYAYYPTPGGATTTMVYSLQGNVSVVAGQTTSGVNFSW
jgi:Tfp pilus assembly protein PilE